MNNNDTYEQEIDLKDLLFAVLYKWRLICVVAVALAVVLGVYRGVKIYQPGTDEQTLAEAEAAYQKDLEAYEQTRRLYEQEIANMRNQMNYQSEYLEKSVFININPYNVWKASGVWYIGTDDLEEMNNTVSDPAGAGESVSGSRQGSASAEQAPAGAGENSSDSRQGATAAEQVLSGTRQASTGTEQILSGKLQASAGAGQPSESAGQVPAGTDQAADRSNAIVRAYGMALTNADFLEQAAGKIGIEPRYLGELVTVSGENNLMTVEIRYTDKDTAEKIMEEFEAGVESLHNQVSENVFEHTLSKVGSNVNSAVDLELAERQAVMKADREEEELSLQDKQKLLTDLTEPAKPDVSSSSAVSGVIKYAVLGGVLGAFIVVFFVCVAFLMSDKLYSAKQLKNYCNVKIIGTLPLPGRDGKGAINRWLKRIEGRPGPGTEETSYGLIAANVSNYSEEIKTVIVAGAAAAERLREVAERLRRTLPKLTIIAEGDLLHDPEVLKLLPECDGVILVEECGRSAYGDVRLELEKIRDLKKRLIGCVVFE